MEIMRFKGKYTIDSLNVLTNERKRTVIDNVLTQGFFDSIFAFLDQGVTGQDADVIDLNYFAYGEGTTTALRADTLLEDEIFRKLISSKSNTTTKYKCVLSVATSEGNPTGGYIKEIGIFSQGTATEDTGTLISRANTNVQKNSNIQLLITWEMNTI